MGSGTHADIGEGHGPGVRLQANEARVWILTLLPSAELLVGGQWVSRECRRGLPVQEHLVRPIGHLNLVRVPDTQREPLGVRVVLLAGRDTERDLVDGAGPVIWESVRFTLTPVSPRFLVDLDLVPSID